MSVTYRKCATCKEKDVDYYPEHPETKDCLGCATAALERTEKDFLATLTSDAQKDLFRQYKDAFQAKSMVLMSMS